jgi:2-phospho-L-lactate/phosphoenolpyruvate guanylyltransferase
MWAIVPLKTFTQAKQRLAAVLSEEERRALMLAMARDVLGALCQCEGLSGVLIASRTQEADALAAAFNTERFSESPQADLPATLAQASEYLTRHLNARGIMVVPADVPLIDPAEIDQMLQTHDRVTLVPDSENIGTNCLIASPPDSIPFVFDGKSFKPHVDAAFAAGITPAIIPSRSFALDIDTADDLRALLALAPSTQTATFLVKSGIAQRLQATDNAASDARPGSTS